MNDLLGQGNKLISVIITAHNRREYLINAVMSALNQTLDKELYEVIVVKNFTDSNIDKKLSDLNVKNILTEEEGQGGKVTEALKYAGGEIISFLEDDDEFFPEKLEAVYKKFSENKDLVFYENSILFIDKGGKPLFSRERKFHLKGPQSSETFERIFSIGGGFNTSTMSVRRLILEDRLNFYRNIYTSTDAFLLYSAVLSGKEILAEPSILTKFRLHGASTMYNITSFDKYLKNRTFNRFAMLNDAMAIEKMCSGSQYYYSALRWLIASKIAYKLIYGLPNTSYKMLPPKLSFKEILYWINFNLPKSSRELGIRRIFRPFYLLILSEMPGSIKLEIEKIRYHRVIAKYKKGEFHKN